MFQTGPAIAASGDGQNTCKKHIHDGAGAEWTVAMVVFMLFLLRILFDGWWRQAGA